MKRAKIYKFILVFSFTTMISFSRILTIIVVIIAVVAVSSFLYGEYMVAQDSYNSEIRYSFTKSPVSYDYSCGVNEYQIFFTIQNVGIKKVTGVSIKVTNPLCVGSVSQLPRVLNASSTVNFFVQTTSVNGTLTLSGNNTYVQIMF